MLDHANIFNFFNTKFPGVRFQQKKNDQTYKLVHIFIQKRVCLMTYKTETTTLEKYTVTNLSDFLALIVESVSKFSLSFTPKVRI